MHQVCSIRTGVDGSPEFAIHHERNGETISVWHDIPLRNSDQTYNFICEVPKWTRDKMEIQKNLAHNPIKQDIQEDGELRRYRYDIVFNYGALPRTWEDPSVWSEHTMAYGDDDPLDVIEIGSRQLRMASITPVKILGILGMIDNGETDWKVIAIDPADEMASLWNDISDVDTGLLRRVREWLANYKMIDGKPQNTFAFGGAYQSAAFARGIIYECHLAWQSKHAVVTPELDAVLYRDWQSPTAAAGRPAGCGPAATPPGS